MKVIPLVSSLSDIEEYLNDNDKVAKESKRMESKNGIFEDSAEDEKRKKREIRNAYCLEESLHELVRILSSLL